MNGRFARLTLALALGILPLAAQATPPGPQKGMARLAERLNLSEAQKAQVQAIWARHSEGAKARRQAALEARKAFREGLANPDTPEAQLRSLHQAMEAAAFEQLLDHRALQAEIRAVLTPEQRTEWDRRQAFRVGYRMGRKASGH